MNCVQSQEGARTARTRRFRSNRRPSAGSRVGRSLASRSAPHLDMTEEPCEPVGLRRLAGGQPKSRGHWLTPRLLITDGVWQERTENIRSLKGEIEGIRPVDRSGKRPIVSALNVNSGPIAGWPWRHAAAANIACHRQLLASLPRSDQNCNAGNAPGASTSVDTLISRHRFASAERAASASAAYRTASLPIRRCAGSRSLLARRRMT
jgi:hypothetical protein